MRLALLADIHGNLPAFEAVLAHAQTQAPDQLLILGDTVNGAPDSKACWELAQSLNCPLLRGNHERYVTDWDKPDAPVEWRTERFQPVHWTAAQFTPSEREAMAQLPHTLRLPDFPDLFFCHSSARSDNDQVVAFTPEETLAEQFAGVREPYILRGHNHHQMIRLWEEKTLITVGATGLPLDMNPLAQYATLTKRGDRWHLAHHAVPYDLDHLRQRFHASGYFDGAGPMGWLFYRECLTATAQILPFLRAYAMMEDNPSLSVAVGRYGSGLANP